MDSEKFREALEYCRKSMSFVLPKREMPYVDWALHEVIGIFKETQDEEIFFESLKEFKDFLYCSNSRDLPLKRFALAGKAVETIYTIARFREWNVEAIF